MPVRKAEAVWEGTLKEGKGVMKLGSGAYEGAYTYATRFEEEPGTNPEELIGAAHAGCFSMFLSAVLTGAGFPPNRIETSAKVYLEQVDGAPWITKINLTCRADVPGVDQATFMEKVDVSKKGCPVSKALGAVKEVNVDAALV
ncbi:MAG: Peroxiredoxin OsmC [Anaerolineae bacterium]|nr:Peroxiredoxin OsmC [Anaerolineae bacterium]